MIDECEGWERRGLELGKYIELGKKLPFSEWDRIT
jgi:hypothetical protein